MSGSIKISLVEEFLVARNWVEIKQNNRFKIYAAPVDVDSSQNFKLFIPITNSGRELSVTVQPILETLAEIYEQSVNRLYALMSENAEIIGVRLLGDDTKDGTASLADFESLFLYLQKALTHSVGFALSNLVVNSGIAPEAEEYIRRCRMLQTEKGSFVANIQVPENLVLQAEGVLQEQITSYDVTRKFEDVLSLVVDDVLDGHVDPCTDAFIEAHSARINVNVLEHVENLFTKTKCEQIDFTFLSRRRSQKIVASNLDRARLEAVSRFAKYARTKFADLIPINTTGKIVELRSKNPGRNRNYVMVASDVEKDMVIGVVLDNPTYQIAISAHRTGKSIRISGEAIQLKTKLRIEKLHSFDLA